MHRGAGNLRCERLVGGLVGLGRRPLRYDDDRPVEHQHKEGRKNNADYAQKKCGPDLLTTGAGGPVPWLENEDNDDDDDADAGADLKTESTGV